MELDPGWRSHLSLMVPLGKLPTLLLMMLPESQIGSWMEHTLRAPQRRDMPDCPLNWNRQ